MGQIPEGVPFGAATVSGRGRMAGREALCRRDVVAHLGSRSWVGFAGAAQRRLRETVTSTRESVDVGGDRLVFWKAKSEEVEGEIYGPVWIADANDPNVTLEEHDAWLTWEQAEEFARKRGLPIEDV